MLRVVVLKNWLDGQTSQALIYKSRTLIYKPVKFGRFFVVANHASDLPPFGPDSTYLGFNIMIDDFELMHNGFKLPELFQLDGWLRMNNSRVQAL